MFRKILIKFRKHYQVILIKQTNYKNKKKLTIYNPKTLFYRVYFKDYLVFFHLIFCCYLLYSLNLPPSRRPPLSLSLDDSLFYFSFSCVHTSSYLHVRHCQIWIFPRLDFSLSRFYILCNLYLSLTVFLFCMFKCSLLI
jgi:hypothetical protein